MPLVARSVTAFSFITTRNGTAIDSSLIETDGYLEEVRCIQPASVLRQLSITWLIGRRLSHVGTIQHFLFLSVITGRRYHAKCFQTDSETYTTASLDSQTTE